MFKKILILTMSLSTIALVGCGSGSSSGSSSSSVSTGTEYSGANLEGGNVTQLTLNGSNHGSINLGTVTNSSEYVLAVYSYNEDGDTVAYQLGSSNETAASLAALVADNSESENTTEDFHQMLRESENDLEPSAMISPSASHTRALIKQATIGSTRTFKVLNSFSGGASYTTVTAVLRYETANFKAYVDQRNAGSLSDGEIATLSTNFDAKISKEREIFGEESDVDNDGKFNVLFTQAVNELGGSAGGIITGFFYAVDLFDDAVYSQSNETEVFYTFVPDPSGSFGVAISKNFALSNILPSVLPHEFQHMINFNNHYFENSSSPEYSFLNEGLSHLAEDIYSLDSSDYMTATGIENPARVEGYLDSVDNLCITCGSSLYQRGGSYLLLRYLYEQAEKGHLTASASGKEFIRNLIDTNKTGVANIVNATYGSSNITATFADIMGSFGLAMFLSDTGLTDDDRLEIDGLDLRATQSDNRGTVLQGPGINSLSQFPMSDTLGAASISYVRMTGNQINAQNGIISLDLTSGYTGGAYLVQTGL